MDSGGSDNTAPGELLLRRGDTAPLNDGAYTVEFVRYDLEPDPDAVGIPADSLDLSVGAELKVTNTATGEVRTISPGLPHPHRP